jgi:hypothetical protein
MQLPKSLGIIRHGPGPQCSNLLTIHNKGLQPDPGKVAPQALRQPSITGEIVMTSLAYTPATREPLTTLVTELFGDQPAPASPLPTSDHTAETSWQDAVTQVGEQLRAKLHVEALPERLHKALALVLAHAVVYP